MSAPEQRPAHRFRCGPLVAFQQVPVHVLGDGDAGMTHLGDNMQRRPLGQHQRGARMAQFMRMPMPQACPLAQPGEGAREVSGSIGVPTSLAKINP
jgi:hypothetical protein